MFLLRKAVDEIIAEIINSKTAVFVRLFVCFVWSFVLLSLWICWREDVDEANRTEMMAEWQGVDKPKPPVG